VIDFGQSMAGLAAAMLLADNGAEVVRIDRSEGSCGRAPEADKRLNRGKQRVRLDLEDPLDLEEARRLVASADVVVEDSRPGEMARLGLDYRSLETTVPGLVYLSVPGFASTDEEHRDAAAYEAVIAAAVGQFADMGVNRVLMGVDASYSPLPLGSAYAAVFGAMAVVLALRARLGHRNGDHIEVPIASSLSEALAYNAMDVADLPTRYLSRREKEILRRRGRSLPMDVGYEALHDLLDPFYRAYWCADGRPLDLVAVAHRAHPRRVLELLGIFEEAVAAGLPMFDPYLSTSAWPDGADCTLYAHPISDTWARWLSSRIASSLSTRAAADWEELFAEHGVPAAAHRTTEEWMSSEHALQSGLVVETDEPDTGRTRQMGAVAWTEYRETGDAAEAATPTPVRASPDGLPPAWLSDVTVVDLTNVIAGPTIGSTLARFGARVIKVDPPRPTFDPWTTILCGIHSNRGKESVLLDARHHDGRSVLHRLIAEADVCTVNASKRQLVSLGLSPRDFAEIAPNTVLCQLDAWSGPAGGPWADRLGYDDLVQAATGIKARFGGGLLTPEEHAHFGTIDVLGGLCAALSAALALYARDKTGCVLVARASLAAAGQFIQLPFFYDHERRHPWDEPAGPHARGDGPGYRLYRALDAWMFVVIPDREALLNLSPVMGEDIGDLPPGQLADRLAERFAARPVENWRQELTPLNVGIQRLASMAQVREQHTHAESAPWTASSFNFTRIADHPAGRPVTLPAPVAVRPTRAPVVVPANAPKYGQHTREVLSELGYGPSEIDGLLRSGAAGLAWSDGYLPD
jgi:crotonobetainyl-CoA:carnitine CoA-transferase CaiB-like acyl-CoA transferase